VLIKRQNNSKEAVKIKVTWWKTFDICNTGNKCNTCVDMKLFVLKWQKCQKFLMLIPSVNVKINIKKFGDNYYNPSDFISHN